MDFNQAITTIINSNKEIEAIKILILQIAEYIEQIEDTNLHMSACLKAIQKINNNKNKAIDALCEKED